MYQLQFDGGSRGNPGPSGCGAVLLQNSVVVWSGNQYLNETTNNVAEYCGLLLGLQYVIEANIADLAIEGDSNLVVQQVNNRWKVKDAKMIELHALATKLLKKIPNWTLGYIPRAQNAKADTQANLAMNRGCNV